MTRVGYICFAIPSIRKSQTHRNITTKIKEPGHILILKRGHIYIFIASQGRFKSKRQCSKRVTQDKSRADKYHHTTLFPAITMMLYVFLTTTLTALLFDFCIVLSYTSFLSFIANDLRFLHCLLDSGSSNIS